MKTEVQGIIWCLVFLVLDAIQAVFFGGFLQRIDAFYTGALVFGLPSVLVLGWLWLNGRQQLSRAVANSSALAGLNVTTAGAWITYLIALQLIEPAIAFTLFSGIIPVAAIAARRFGFDEALPVRNRTEAVGYVVILTGMAVLIAITLYGLSGFVRGSVAAAATGLTLALLSGVLITGMLLYGGRLHVSGVRPLAQFGLRFPLYTVLAIGGYLLGVDAKAPPTPGDTIIILTVGMILLAFPIYAVQKAVAMTSALTIGTFAATGPLLVFAFQLAEGRVEYAPATAVGLTIYFIGALLAAFGAAIRGTPASGKKVDARQS